MNIVLALLVAASFGETAFPQVITSGENVAPTVTITSNGGAAYDSLTSSTTVSGTTNATVSVTWAVDGGAETACTLVIGTTFSCAVTGLDANEADTVTVKAYDSTALSATDTQAVTYLAPCGDGVTPLVWYRAQSEGEANGASVAAVDSLGSISGAGLSQATGAAQPTHLDNCINGEDCWTFDGNRWLRSAAFTPTAQAYTICAVAGRSASGATQTVADGEDGTNRAILRIDTSDLWEIFAGTILDGPASSSSSFDVACGHFNGASSTVAVNGVDGSTGSANSAAVDGFTIGANITTSNRLTGRVATVALCAGDKRTAFKSYADADYGSSWPKAW